MGFSDPVMTIGMRRPNICRDTWPVLPVVERDLLVIPGKAMNHTGVTTISPGSVNYNCVPYDQR